VPHPALRSALLPCAALAAVFTAGCDPDCSSPGRVDGSYDTVARSTKDTWQISGFSTDGDVDEQLAQAELLSQLPLNGQRAWALKYVPGDDSYTLSIDEQRVIAKATPSDDNCNQLALRADGSFEGEAGSLHEFSLEADLLWTGDGLSGTFSYADAWTWDGRSGEVRLPDGELLATLAD
jgi:hypothetical protein